MENNKLKPIVLASAVLFLVFIGFLVGVGFSTGYLGIMEIPSEWWIAIVQAGVTVLSVIGGFVTAMWVQRSQENHDRELEDQRREVDRVREVRTWFRATYIDGCIDPLHNFVLALQMQAELLEVAHGVGEQLEQSQLEMAGQGQEMFEKMTPKSEIKFPGTALNRLTELTGLDTLERWLVNRSTGYFYNNYYRNIGEVKKIKGQCEAIKKYISLLRQILIGLPITERDHVYAIAESQAIEQLNDWFFPNKEEVEDAEDTVLLVDELSGLPDEVKEAAERKPAVRQQDVES